MIDLHMHSTFSDGSLTPEELLDTAEQCGLSAIALTDHDTTGGIPRLLAAAGGKRVRPIPGVEISAEFSPGTMHMLGYFIRPDDPMLNERLEWIRDGREKRNRVILQKLNALGFALAWEEVAAFAGEDVVGRPHFAQALLARGMVADKTEAFDKYLGKGKPAYADRPRYSAADSVRMIREAGGVPVLAHPVTLNLSPADLRNLAMELRDQGLEGIEVYYSEHKQEQQIAFYQMAEDFNLVTTGGSDFHGAMNPDIRMGVGFGGLRVPDDVVAKLEARRPS